MKPRLVIYLASILCIAILNLCLIHLDMRGLALFLVGPPFICAGFITGKLGGDSAWAMHLWLFFASIVYYGLAFMPILLWARNALPAVIWSLLAAGFHLFAFKLLQGLAQI